MAAGVRSWRFLSPAVGGYSSDVRFTEMVSICPALFPSELSNDQSTLILKTQLDFPF